MFKLLGLAFALALVFAEAQKYCPSFKEVEKCDSKKNVLCIDPPKDGDSCPTVECLPKRTKSPLNPKKKCFTRCPVHCGDQLTCPRPKSKNGCDKGSVCVPRNPLCTEQSCPLNCPSGQMECPTEFNELGCPLNTECVPKKDKNGCPTICPSHCPTGTTPCEGGQDMNGCPLPGTCVPILANGTCPGSCPVACGPDEMACPQGIGPTGCPLPDTCIPIDPTSPCPPSCPCLPSQQSCPGPLDSDGCPTFECNDLFDQITGCPSTCPCPENWINCPNGLTNGCPNEPDCIDPTLLGPDGCPASCPCDIDELSCPIPGTDPNCPDKTCVPVVDYILNPNGCPNSCANAVGCPNGLQSCPLSGSFDPTCPPLMQCVPSTDQNGCPLSCPCATDELTCYVPSDVPGCPDVAQCLPAFDTITGCPSFCPTTDTTCPPDFQYCPGLTEPDGCPAQFKCIPMFDAMNCPQTCPVPCDLTMNQFCHAGWDPDTNCPFPEICLPKYNGPCFNFCPCPSGDFSCQSGDFMDGQFLCPGPPLCYPIPDGAPGGSNGCFPSCPCKSGEKQCPNLGGLDGNQCIGSHFCVPWDGSCPT